MRTINKKHKMFFIILFLFNASFSYGQSDYLYNQFVPLDFILNPAKVANEKNGVYLFWRNQWSGFKNNPQFYSASGHFLIHNNLYLGGVISKNDYGGAFSNHTIQISTAWRGRLPGEGHFFSLGIACKGNQLKSDFSDIVLLDQNDLEFPQSITMKNYIDYSAGFSYRYKFLKTGLSSTSLIGLLGEKKEFPYNKTIIAELGFLLNKDKNKESNSDGITQLNFRSRFSDSKVWQVETLFDYFASANYGIGCGFRFDFRENKGNSIIFHILFKLSKDNGKGRKALIGFGPEFSVFNNSLNQSNKGSYEGFGGYEFPVKKSTK